MPTRTFPRVASALQRQPPDADEALTLTESAPDIPPSHDGEDGHIPTLPFGTRAGVLRPAAAPRDSRSGKEPSRRFRFLVPTLPTSLRQAGEQQTPGGLQSPTATSSHTPKADELDPPPKSRWLWLGASVVAMLASLLLLWPGESNVPQGATLPRKPPSLVRRAPESAPVRTETDPSTRANAPQDPALAQGITPALRAKPSPPQSTAPSHGPTHPPSPTGARPTVSKSLTTLKGESVLASVLAPPPAD
jgi:hypothetical protein